MKLSQLHEAYIRQAEKPLYGMHKLPVIPKNDERIVIPTAKWMVNDDKLEKTYRFLSTKVRNLFLTEILDYETEIGHHAVLSVEQKTVFIQLSTKDTDKFSELDKEYARHADLVYKDVLYNNI